MSAGADLFLALRTVLLFLEVVIVPSSLLWLWGSASGFRRMTFRINRFRGYCTRNVPSLPHDTGVTAVVL